MDDVCVVWKRWWRRRGERVLPTILLCLSWYVVCEDFDMGDMGDMGDVMYVAVY